MALYCSIADETFVGVVIFGNVDADDRESLDNTLVVVERGIESPRSN